MNNIIDNGKNKIIKFFDKNIRGKKITKNKSDYDGAVGRVALVLTISK